MKATHGVALAAVGSLLVLLTASPAAAKVTVLQQGVSPTAAYAGCKDTWISDEQWERMRHNGRSATARCGGKRHVLVRFDLSPIPAGETIHKAVLRIWDIGFPRPGRDGQWPQGLEAVALTREWADSANWLDHTRPQKRGDTVNRWKTPGGEIDGAAKSAPGVFGRGAFGHVRELDVTELVRGWHTGRRANHGLALRGLHCSLATADWHVPAFRPQLLVDHGVKAARITPLTPAPQEIGLDPISDAVLLPVDDDEGEVCVGQNANCALRSASTDAYVKDAAAKYPGTWGWMTECRVGGVAGDCNHALLRFDLSGLPANAVIKQARLVLSLVTSGGLNRHVRTYRYGAFLVKLPDAPGWVDAEVTAAERKVGVPWPAGGVLAASSAAPVAIGKVTQKEILQRGRKRRIDGYMEFDLTGVVRAWVAGKAPNCGIVLDGRIEGGAYDFYSSRAWDPALRPYLKITCSPAVTAKPTPVKVTPALPPGDYWLEPMRKVHARFKGKPGTLSQYGDSITVTMAYLAGYSWKNKIDAKNMTPAVRNEMDLVEKHADLSLWRRWKGGEWGNTGMMRSDWLFGNVDAWQKKMNAEAAVILFGTNDRGGLVPPQYTEYMAASCRRMTADGTVPMLTTIPPPRARDYWLAGLSIARGLKVPVIDYYAEIMRRRPDDYNGRDAKFNAYKGYDVPTLISRDGTHPSNPAKYRGDWSEEALNCSGYGLRDYMTLRKYAEIIRKVFRAERE